MGAIPTPEPLKGKRVLMVLAHPDDEVIFGWPILRMEGMTKGLFTVSYNRCGSLSQKPLLEVCERNGVRLVGLPVCMNNFYRLPPRYETPTLQEVTSKIIMGLQDSITRFRPDFLFTHNPIGEYGHGDHRFLFNVCTLMSNPLLMTDICQTNNCHLSTERIPRVFRETFYRLECRLGSFSLDLEWYEGMKQIYEQGKAWTWGGHDPVTDCGLYLI